MNIDLDKRQLINVLYLFVYLALNYVTKYENSRDNLSGKQYTS